MGCMISGPSVFWMRVRVVKGRCTSTYSQSGNIRRILLSDLWLPNVDFFDV